MTAVSAYDRLCDYSSWNIGFNSNLSYINEKISILHLHYLSSRLVNRVLLWLQVLKFTSLNYIHRVFLVQRDYELGRVFCKRILFWNTVPSWSWFVQQESQTFFALNIYQSSSVEQSSDQPEVGAAALINKGVSARMRAAAWLTCLR